MSEVETARDMLSNGISDNSTASPDNTDSQSDPRKLFVGGIPYDAVAQDLLNYFERYGPIREAVVIRDKNNPLQNQGYGFVIFEDPRVAQWVLTTEKNPIIKGRKANVQKGHKRSGLPSITNGIHLPAADAASVLPSFYYTEPLSVVDTRESTAATGILPLNQVSWPMTNERLLAAASAFGNGYQYGTHPLMSVQDQWTQSLLVQQQQQQQQNSMFIPQAGVILPTSHLAPTSPTYAAAAAAAGLSPSTSWAANNLVHPTNGFNLLGTAAYVPTAAAASAVTQASALNAFAAAVASQQQMNGLMAAAAPAALCTTTSHNGVGGANPHSLWRAASPNEAQPSLVTYVASPSHSPPAGITSLTHVLEQSNGVA